MTTKRMKPLCRQWLLAIVGLLLSAGAFAQTYTLSLTNPSVNGTPFLPNDVIQGFQPGDTALFSFDPTLTITGGTGPLPDDVIIDFTYDTAGLNGVNATPSAGWGCDASQPGFISCSLTNPLGSVIPQLQIGIQVLTTAPVGTFNVNVQSALLFLNGAPQTATLVEDSTSVGISTAAAAANADMGVQLNVDPNPVASNLSGDVYVNWTNNGPDAATNAQLTVNFPAGSSNISAFDFASSWTCNTTGLTVICTQPSIPTGTTGTLQINFDPPPTVGSYTVTASIGANEADGNPANDTASASFAVEAPYADVSTSTSVTPTQAQPGDTVNFTVNMRNLGNQPIFDVGVRFKVSPSQNIVSTQEPAGWQCIFDSVANSYECFTATRGNQPVEPAGKAGTSLNFSFRVQISANETASSVTGTASLVDLFAGSQYADQNPGNDVSSATVTLGRPEADLEISKQGIFTAPLNNGDTFLYRIKVTNHGPQAAPNVVISDQLPNNVELLSVDAPLGWTCIPSRGVAANMQCSFNRTLSPPDSQTIEQTVRYLGGAAVVETTASVTSDADDPQSSNNSVTRTDNVVTGSVVDLQLSQTVSSTQVAPGGQLTATYVVQNLSQSTATGVTLDIQHGNLLSYLSKVGPDWSCAQTGSNTSCTLATDMQPGASESLSVDFQAAQTEGVVDLLATVSSLETDAVPENNTQQERVSIGQGGDNQPFDLQLALVSSVQSPTPGQQFSIEAVIDNLGPGTASRVALDLELPAGLSLLQASGEGWQCESMRKVPNLYCEFAGVMANGEQTRVILDVEARGQIGDMFSVAGMVYVLEGYELNAGNSNATLDIYLSGGPLGHQVQLSGEADKSQVRSGESVRYSIEIGNTGSSALQAAYLEARLNGPARFSAQAKAADCVLQDDQTLRCGLPEGLAAGTTTRFTFAALAQPVSSSGVISMHASLVDANDTGNRSDVLVIDVLYLGLSSDDLRRLLEDAAGDDEIANGAVGPIEEMCLSPANALEQAFCDALFSALENGRLSDVRSVLRAVNPRAVITQTSAMVEVSSAQFRNIDARMNELRAGTGGFSMNGLNLRYGDQRFQLANLRYLMDDDRKALNSGLASPWGVFVNGTISAGDRDPTTREIGFDFSSTGITAGIDYRFTDNFVLGAALGYADFGSDDLDGGSLDTSGVTLTGYLSWYPKDKLYVDARISQGWLDVEQKRKVRFSIGQVEQDVLMSGSTSAAQTTLAISTGMHFNRDGFVVTPNLSMRYMSTSVDGYDERAFGIGAVHYSSFDFDSLELSAGLQMNKTFSLDTGVLTPQLDAAFRYETQNDGMVIEARLLGRQSPFLIRTDSPDRGYGSLGGGLVYVTNGGKQFYFTYRQLLGLEGFSQYTVNLGLRMEF